MAGDVGVLERDLARTTTRPVAGGHGGETQLTYVPGLDGLRGLSVLAVMLYHFRPDRSLLRGGYLGVEVFFVISGYLITSLLLAERRRHGRVSLRRFWLRRIRRLWPALFTMLVVTGLVVAVFYHEDLGRLKGDLFFGFYAENWWQVFHHVSYFAADAVVTGHARQPFQHLWSLAVEEQFYVFWPVEVALGIFLLGRRRFRVFVAAQAAVGWGLMVWLAASGSTNHAYLGTETRMMGLLLGCLLAFSWSPYRLRGPAAPSAGRVLDAAAVAALAVLGVLFFTLRESNTGLYYWGFLLVDAATLTLIAAIMHPSSNANRVLGNRVLRTVGLRSYGIYLWGIAIFEFTRPGIDWDPPGWVVWLVRVVLVAGVTELSYRKLEVPIRRGAIGRAWHDLRTADGERHHRLVVRWQSAVVAFVLAVAGLSTAAVAATDHEPCDITNCLTKAGGGNDVLNGATVPTAPQTLPPGTTVATTRGSKGPGTHTTTTAPTHNPTLVGALPASETGGWAVTGVGDSVMLGASTSLANVLSPVLGPVNVNAAVSRMDFICVDVLRALEAQHRLGSLVLVHCGNNGTMQSSFVDQVMQIAGPKRHVVFFTLKVPRGWEAGNNAIITSGAARYRNARVLDWHWFGEHQPPWFFYQDQYHLTPPGRAFYAQLTLDTLRNTWHWAQ